MTHELQKLVMSAMGFAASAAWLLFLQLTENLDAESLIGYGVGAVSTGTVFWLVWTDRKGTTRADITQEARISELKTQLDEMTEDRDFWRARALKIKLSATVEVVEDIEG